MHIETGGSAALQTASQVAGKGNARIRVLFDGVSHTLFVTSRVAKEFSLETCRKSGFLSTPLDKGQWVPTSGR